MKIKTKNKNILTTKRYLILPVLIATIVAVLFLLYNRNDIRKQRTTQLPLTNPSSMKDESWTTSKIDAINNSHYLAYIKTSDQNIWLVDINIDKEFLAFPKIDKTYFCKDGCITRSFSFSPDGKKLIADLVISNGNTGFGYISLDKISQDNEIHFVRDGYNPFFNPDGSIILFYDKSYLPRTLSYIDTSDSRVISVGEFIAVGWLSKNELLLSSNKVQKEKGTFYKYNIVNSKLNKIVMNDTFTKGKDITPVSISPVKDKILVKTYDGHAKLGVTRSDGTGYTQIGGTDSPFGAWSPDGKMIATQNISIYPTTISDSIQITSLNDFAIKKSINVDIGYSSSLCWLPNVQGDLIIFTTKNNEIVLYNLKNDGTRSIKRDLYDGGNFTCY